MDDAGLGLGARQPLLSWGYVGGTWFLVVSKSLGCFEVVVGSCGFRVVFLVGVGFGCWWGCCHDEVSVDVAVCAWALVF